MSCEKLREFVFGLEIMDTHEHLPTFEKSRPKGMDVLAEYLQHYFSCDLVSAGLSDEGLILARDATKPLMKRWRTVEPCWEAARHTGYGRALDIAAREIYGIPQINGRTLGRLNEAFLESVAKGGQYEKVLKKISRIRLSIEDAGSSCVSAPKDCVDRKFFRPVVRCDAFIAPGSKAGFDELQRLSGVTIHTLADLKRACEVHVERSIKGGAVGLKCGLAYQRSLRFDKVGEREAEEDFKKFFSDPNVVSGRAGEGEDPAVDLLGERPRAVLAGDLRVTGHAVDEAVVAAEAEQLVRGDRVEVFDHRADGGLGRDDVRPREVDEHVAKILRERQERLLVRIAEVEDVELDVAVFHEEVRQQ